MPSALGAALLVAAALIGIVLAFCIGTATGRRRERQARELQLRLGAAVELGRTRRPEAVWRGITPGSRRDRSPVSPGRRGLDA